MYLEGIDVSRWNLDIDWEQAAPLIKFGYIQATEGSNVINRRFLRDWSELKRLSIPRGAYHFFDPEEGVDAQVKNFLSVIGVPEAGDLPPMLCVAGQWKWEFVKFERRLYLIVAFLEAVEKALGVTPVVCLGHYFAERMLGTQWLPKLRRYRLCIVNLMDVSEPRVPAPWSRFHFWRYDDDGHIDGIITRVNKNRFSGDENDLDSLRTKLSGNSAKSPKAYPPKSNSAGRSRRNPNWRPRSQCMH